MAGATEGLFTSGFVLLHDRRALQTSFVDLYMLGDFSAQSLFIRAQRDQVDHQQTCRLLVASCNTVLTT